MIYCGGSVPNRRLPIVCVADEIKVPAGRSLLGVYNEKLRNINGITLSGIGINSSTYWEQQMNKKKVNLTCPRGHALPIC